LFRAEGTCSKWKEGDGNGDGGEELGCVCVCVCGGIERASGRERVSLWKTRREGDELGAKFRLCLPFANSKYFL
jgi:hypothetical protein